MKLHSLLLVIHNGAGEGWSKLVDVAVTAGGGVAGVRWAIHWFEHDLGTSVPDIALKIRPTCLSFFCGIGINLAFI